jgi:hypothetical protein
MLRKSASARQKIPDNFAPSLEVHAAHDFLFPPKIMSVTSTSTDQLLPQTTNA